MGVASSFTPCSKSIRHRPIGSMSSRFHPLSPRSRGRLFALVKSTKITETGNVFMAAQTLRPLRMNAKCADFSPDTLLARTGP